VNHFPLLDSLDAAPERAVPAANTIAMEVFRVAEGSAVTHLKYRVREGYEHVGNSALYPTPQIT